MAPGSNNYFVAALGHLLIDYLIACTRTKRRTKAVYALSVDRQFFSKDLVRFDREESRSIVSCQGNTFSLHLINRLEPKRTTR